MRGWLSRCWVLKGSWETGFANWKQLCPSPRPLLALLGSGERGSVGSGLTCRLLFVCFLLCRTNPGIVGSIDKRLLNALGGSPWGLQVLETLTNKSTHGSWKS